MVAIGQLFKAIADTYGDAPWTDPSDARPSTTAATTPPPTLPADDLLSFDDLDALYPGLFPPASSAPAAAS